MRIRLASAPDVGHIQRLLLDLAGDLGRASDILGDEEDLLRHGFGKYPLFQALLAFEDETPVGLVVFFPEYSSWRGVPGVYVQDLYVAPAQRGQGLGNRLLEEVRTQASGWDARYMKLTVYDRNPRALAFYQSMGFDIRDDETPLVWHWQ